MPCGLVGPATGEPAVPEIAVRYVVRGDRKCASRVLTGQPVQVHTVTVIAGPAGKEDGLPEAHPCVLYTAYGGPQAPPRAGRPDHLLVGGVGGVQGLLGAARDHRGVTGQGFVQAKTPRRTNP